MIEAFDKDPFKCPHCQRQMELVGIWHSRIWMIYHYMEDIEKERRRKYGLVQKQRTG